jgi:class 3 adenylate cyclase
MLVAVKHLTVSRLSASDRQGRIVAVVEPGLLAVFGAVSGFTDGVATMRHVAFAFCSSCVSVENRHEKGETYLGRKRLG